MGLAILASSGYRLGMLLDAPQHTDQPLQQLITWGLKEYSLEGLLLKLKLQYFGHLM